MISQYLPTSSDEEELIFAIQEYCETSDGALWRPLFKAILWNLYEVELISEDAILAWAREHEDVDEGDSFYISMVNYMFSFLFFHFLYLLFTF